MAPGTASRSSGWIRTSASGQRSLQRAELGDVVAVVVGEQDVGDVEVVLVGLGDQRLDGAAGVDEEGVAARAGRDEVGVRQPAVAHGTFEDHGWDTTRRCRADAGCSPRSSRSAGSTWAGFLYAGFRAKRPAWVAAGCGLPGSSRSSRCSSSRSTTTRTASRTTSATSSCSRPGASASCTSFLTRKAYVRRIDMLDDPALERARARAAERRAFARELAQARPGARARGADRPRRRLRRGRRRRRQPRAGRGHRRPPGHRRRHRAPDRRGPRRRRRLLLARGPRHDDGPAGRRGRAAARPRRLPPR